MSTPWINSGAGNSAKSWKNHFQGFGMARFFTLTEAAATAYTGASTVSQFATDAFNEDPNTFQNLGYGVGGTLGQAAFTLATARTAYDSWATRTGGIEATKYSGKVYPRGSGSGLAPNVDKLKGAQKGLLRNGKFIKPMSFKRDLLYMASAAVGGIVASSALGMMGSFIDQQISDKKQRDGMNYDDRYFDTRRYDQSTYGQVGMAMGNYNDKMLSVARIYHSR